ncbi:transketolase family protein [Patescibacteria group bacterium]
MILKSVRDGFGEGLVEAGENNKDVVVLCADLSESTRVDGFAKRFPERFFEVGVAEQALVTVAAGMAEAGKIPFTASYAVFSPGRTFEQIKVTASLNDLPVKIVGAHAGLGAAPYGATHQSLEDISLMRSIPNTVVVSPCDFNEAKKATLAVAENKKPTYLRLARQETPIITSETDAFEIGKANILHQTKDPQVVIIGTGCILSKVLDAVKELAIDGIEVNVVNLHTIKPIDKQAVIHQAKITGGIVTVEEHQIMGGMGSSVSEVISANFPVPIEFVGVNDSFGESARDYRELWKKFGLTKEGIIEAVKKVITRKNY